MTDTTLEEPTLVDPPNCACRGHSPQMREHTAKWCSVLTTDELNTLTRRSDADLLVEDEWP